jgi:hypothetical protein
MRMKWERIASTWPRWTLRDTANLSVLAFRLCKYLIRFPKHDQQVKQGFLESLPRVWGDQSIEMLTLVRIEGPDELIP